MRKAGVRVRTVWLLPLLVAGSAVPGSAGAAVVSGARAPHVAPRLAAVVRGRVTDRESGQPVPSAQVVVVGSLNIGAITNANGDYVLRGVSAGAVVLRISRIGYEPTRVSVTTVDNGEAVANATLSRAAARLEDVVTTATGDQSRRSLGNVVATVNADSLAKTAPIKSIQDVLQARTAGVQVIQGQGVVGGSPKIRIRGNSSLSLSNEPLVVVDGIRFDGGGEQGNTSGITINRLSTIDPETIESLDIIKGPSAAALYGTAAANGVIVVKTKRGSTGAPRWSTFAEGGISQIPATYPANFRSFGRNLVNGVPSAAPVQCTITNASLKSCVIDSLSVYNPWTAAETNPFANGASGNVGVQVSGGTEAVKYFVSADRQGDSGPYRMPDFEIARITDIRGTAPREEQITPNHLRQTSVRGSFTFPLASNATLDISTSYQDRDLFTPFDGTFFAGLSNQLFSAPGFKNATNGTAREFVGDIFSVTNRLTNERFTGNGSINWTPIAWLHLTGEGGLDNSNANNSQYQYPGEGTNKAAAWGPNAAQNYSGIDIYKTNTLQYTATLRAAATRQLSSSIGTQTTVGAQWFRTASDQLFGEGYGLGVGATTPTAASQRLASTTTTQNATYGYYVQEQLSLRGEKLFITGSARTDLNSSFGRNVGNTVYPSANASYVISEESWFRKPAIVDQLRLRATMGQAGLQPSTTAALAFLSPLTYPISGGSEIAGLTIASIGNAALRPEVTTEVESGFDLAMLKGRLNVEFTYFNKSSRDQIFARPLPPSYGVGGTQTVNIARVTNKGVELTFDAQLLQTRMLAWGLRFNGSHLANKLVDVGDVVLPAPQATRNVVGYPLFGLWDRPYTFSDANADGVITPNEITLASADAYKGSTLPEYEAGLSNSFQLFNNKISINTLLDYRGKFWNSYRIGLNRCVSSKNCETVNKPGSSLEDQAAAVAAGTAALNNTQWGLFQKNDFIKLREISVAGNVPDHFVGRYLRGRSAQVVLSGRNLATLWTRYPGIDPEANRLANGNDDLGTPPALRTYNVRLNLAF